MKLKVFFLNKNKHLEPSSRAVFLETFRDSKSHYWIDIENPNPASLEEFLSLLELHPLILEGCLDPTETSHVAPYRQSLFIKFSIQLELDIPEQSFLTIICLRQAIITIHERSIPTIENIAAEFSSAVRFHALSTAAIAYQILDHLIDDDMAFVLKFRREIESLEEAIDQMADSVQTDQIMMLKQRVARLSKTCDDQRFCMTALQTIESDVFDISYFREYFRDSLTNLEYTIRSVDRQQTHLSELRQHYQLTLQERTNKRLRLLTILSAVFMPLTLIAGIYGMNFRYMPELKWPYSYPLVIAVMIALAVTLLWIFYRKGWFK